MICPHCNTPCIGVEYSPGCGAYYDGVSERHCLDCKKRWGRWTGTELKEGELETPHGKRPPFVPVLCKECKSMKHDPQFPTCWDCHDQS